MATIPRRYWENSWHKRSTEATNIGEGNGKIQIVAWTLPEQSNSKAEWSKGRDHGVPKADVPLGPDMLQGSRTPGGSVQLSIGIWETGNEQSVEIVQRFVPIWRRTVRAKWRWIVACNVENIRAKTYYINARTENEIETNRILTCVKYIEVHSWRSGFSRKKWTWLLEFEPWTKLFTLLQLGKTIFGLVLLKAYQFLWFI